MAKRSDEAPTMDTNEVEEETRWSNIPEDLLLLITNFLPLVDRFHLALVSKRFLTVVRRSPRKNGLLLGLPCLFLVANGSKTCSLINPLHKEKYLLNITGLPSKVEVLSSKGGWLLMASQIDRTSIFFFNPLSKAKINLPNIDFRVSSAFSFTTPPTSPDCLVVAVIGIIDQAIVYICRRGDDKWREKIYDFEGVEFRMKYSYPVFHRGRFYCLGNNGTLGVFDPIDESWVVLEKPRPENLRTHRIHLLEHDGQLFRVWAAKMGDFVGIHKLDSVTSNWTAVDNTGGQFYVGGVASVSSNPGSKQGGRIYFRVLRDEDLVFHSCETSEMQPGGRNFCGTKEYPMSCWIEPQWVKPSPEELQWCKVQPKLLLE